jgi:hypothetical protein
VEEIFMNHDRLKIMRITVKIMLTVGVAVIVFGSCVAYTAKLERSGYIQGKLNLQYDGTTTFNAGEFARREQAKKTKPPLASGVSPSVTDGSQTTTPSNLQVSVVTSVGGITSGNIVTGIAPPNLATTTVPQYRPREDITTTPTTTPELSSN